MLASYLKIAAAVFRRRPFFTAVSLFGISFTLAMLMMAAAILDHLFGSVPPEVHQRRTLGLFSCVVSGEGGRSHSAFSYSVLDRCIRDLPGAEEQSIVSFPRMVTSFVETGRIESYLKLADAAFWRITAFDFVEGRAFTHDEESSAAMVAVINRSTRRRFFGNEPANGRMIEADGRRYRVVGVVEDVPFFRIATCADIWVPLTTDASVHKRGRIRGTFIGLILAGSRADFPSIRSEFVNRIQAEDLSGEGRFDRIVAVPETPFQLVSRMLFAGGETTDSHVAGLLGLVVVLMVLFMVLPAINLVNLNISRIMERMSEIGVRKAFGAPSLTLVGQFLIENLILTLGGGVLALGLAWIGLGLIDNSGLIPYATFSLNLRVFAVAILTTLVFGLLSGVYPAWRMSRMHPVDALRGGAS